MITEETWIPPMSLDTVERGAIFSDDRRCRFKLWRTWNTLDRAFGLDTTGRKVVFVMLNPSIAGAYQDDPTVKKCMRYARRWAYSSLTVVNVYPHISTDPKKLDRNLERAKNLAIIEETVESATRVVCAWGKHAHPEDVGIDIPRAAATETFSIVAKRRVGKSNTAVVMAEAFYGEGIQFCSIDPKGDWYGVRADGPKLQGLKVVIFGGLHADVPLPADRGAVIADLIVQSGISCVLDISQFDDVEKSRFLTAFANRLLKVNSDPIHLFLEEADDYLPQVLRFKEQSRCVSAFQKLVRQGGFRGIGVTSITHRSPALDKGILYQTETLIVHRTKAPKDVKSVGEWFEVQGQEGKDILKTVSRLANGEAWIVSHFLGLDEPKRVQFPRRGTFDSGATPEVGQRRRAAATLTAIDLEVVRDQMAEEIERAKADDPVELRARIAELERQIKAKVPPPPPVVKQIEFDPVLLAQIQAVKDLNARFVEVRDSTKDAIDDLRGRVMGAADTLARMTRRSDRPAPKTFPPEAPHRAVLADIQARVIRAKEHAASNGDGDLTKGPREMLRQLVAMRRPLSPHELGVLCAIPPRSSTFRTYRSLLKVHGYIAVNGSGFIEITPAGVERVGSGHMPATAQELYAIWERKLTSGPLRMLKALMHRYPDRITKAELGERAVIDPATSTFRTYMSLLKVRGLVDVQGHTVQATSALFGGDR
jgi:hypothetical protein